MSTNLYRALCSISSFQGPSRSSISEAQCDADDHNEGCASQGGYGRATVVRRDGDRCETLEGEPIWPSHGRSCGAVRWE